MTTKTEAAARYREVADMPIHPVSRQIDGVSLKPVRKASSGLTKREHFAGLAMQGLLANPAVIASLALEQAPEVMRKNIAHAAVVGADHLIAALSQGEGQ